MLIGPAFTIARAVSRISPIFKSNTSPNRESTSKRLESGVSSETIVYTTEKTGIGLFSSSIQYSLTPYGTK